MNSAGTWVHVVRRAIRARADIHRAVWASLLIAGGVLVAFWDATGFGFVFWDDHAYISDNPVTRNGISWSVVIDAFSGPLVSNYHPITILSHALDVEFFGEDGRFHHLTSILLHGANSILLFVVFRLWARDWVAAFLVALLFALHPLRVESVAWVSERKDTLFLFFGLLALLAYTTYVRSGAKSRLWMAAGFYLLSALSKPAAVVVPVLMLLLDHWPFKRVEAGHDYLRLLWPLVREKALFFAIALGIAGATLHAQSTVMQGIDDVGLMDRLINALLGVGAYLRQTVWPVDLSYMYPLKRDISLVWVLISGAAVLGITLFAWVLRKRNPWVIVGWSWFLVSLVPVLGVIQVGNQAHADRYTYLSSIGLVIMGVMLLRETTMWAWGRVILLVLCVAMIPLTKAQTATWKNTDALIEHALEVNPRNHYAIIHLGSYRERNGDFAGAEAAFRQAVEARETSSRAIYELADFLRRQKRWPEAASYFEMLVNNGVDTVPIWNNFGLALHQSGRYDLAAAAYRKALALNDRQADTWYNLGLAYLRGGRVDDGIGALDRVIAIDPGHRKAVDLRKRVTRGE